MSELACAEFGAQLIWSLPVCEVK